MEFVTTGFVHDGKLTVRNRKHFDAWLEKLDRGEVIVTIEKAHATRSEQQNRWYWAVILKHLSEHTGYTAEELHEYCKQRFNSKTLVICNDQGEITDEETVGLSTTKLNKLTFGEYCESIRQWAAELGVVIPDPHEVAA